MDCGVRSAECGPSQGESCSWCRRALDWVFVVSGTRETHSGRRGVWPSETAGRDPFTPYSSPLTFLVTLSERLTQPVMSSGTGRRAALACGVETSPEEYECRVLLGGALRAVGTGTATGTGLGVRSRLNGARTTPGISPCARYSRLVEMTGWGKGRLVEMTGKKRGSLR
jgi:hypothetical protein